MFLKLMPEDIGDLLVLMFIFSCMITFIMQTGLHNRKAEGLTNCGKIGLLAIKISARCLLDNSPTTGENWPLDN